MKKPIEVPVEDMRSGGICQGLGVRSADGNWFTITTPDGTQQIYPWGIVHHAAKEGVAIHENTSLSTKERDAKLHALNERVHAAMIKLPAQHQWS